MTEQFRAPRAILLPEAEENQAKPTRPQKRQPELVFEPEPEIHELVPVPRREVTTAPMGRGWLGILLSALLALIMMWAGLAITELVESFFARNTVLGWIALTLATLAGLAASAIILREVFGLFRLRKIETLQHHASRAINLDERTAAETAITSLVELYADRADMKQPLANLESHRNDILDPRDRVQLADRLLLTGLDAQAHQIIARRARRVTLLTTVTPAAVLDILFVASQNLGMLRELAALYGGRPSTLSTLKLTRMVVTHLAVSGGLALSDNLIQHFVGKGLLGKLSARFGEGAVNGILTARIGLAATAVCRPIPREVGTSDSLSRILKQVLTFGGKDKSNEPD